MSNEEILKKAIEKAVSNGYPDWGVPNGFAVYAVIFSHGFAKAFWGEKAHDFSKRDKIVCCHCYVGITECENEYCWQYHLQQMVLEEDPIKYLEKFL